MVFCGHLVDGTVRPFISNCAGINHELETLARVLKWVIYFLHVLPPTTTDGSLAVAFAYYHAPIPLLYAPGARFQIIQLQEMNQKIGWLVWWEYFQRIIIGLFPVQYSIEKLLNQKTRIQSPSSSVTTRCRFSMAYLTIDVILQQMPNLGRGKEWDKMMEEKNDREVMKSLGNES